MNATLLSQRQAASLAGLDTKTFRACQRRGEIQPTFETHSAMLFEMVTV
jgi:hypothetical protein